MDNNHSQPFTTPYTSRSTAIGVFSLLRTKQWTKNVFVLIPFLFSYKPGLFGLGDIAHLLFAFFSFCFLSSAVYALNDVADRETDRNHPRKCRRPVASGTISVRLALTITFLLILLPFTGGTLLCLFYPAARIPFRSIFIVCGLYLANNILYSFFLRRQELLDVFSIAFGFVLRLLAGCFALKIAPSHWLLICGFSLALLLGFGKRRMELSQQDNSQHQYRKSLMFYTQEYLNILLAVTATVTLTAYMLYSISPETLELHNTKNLIYTSPFVIFGVFRYISAAIAGKVDGPDELLFKDKLFLINIILWGCVSISVLIL